ncbi:MAG: histidine kinase, partial [Nocardioidaceae bacterium]
MDRGSCDPPGGIRAAGAHRWLRGRPLTWNALVWGALLLLDPALDVSRHRPLLPAVLLLVAVAATCVGTGFAAARRTAPYVTDLCLFALASLTITTTLAYGRHWGTLWLLLSIMAGAALRRGRAPYAVVAVTIGAGLAAWAIDGSWTRIWTQALVVFLSGAGTYVFRWLLEVIAELDRTREELARRAVEDERQRFSRDLHDLLGHTLSVIVVKSEAVRRLVHRDPELAASYAGDIE